MILLRNTLAHDRNKYRGVRIFRKKTYAIEDCWNTALAEQTINCTSSSKYSSIGLNSIHDIKNDDFILEFDSKGNGTLCVGHSSYYQSSTNYRVTLGTAEGKHYYSTRSTSTRESYSGTYSSDTYYHYKLTREGSTIKFYVDDTLLGKRLQVSSQITVLGVFTVLYGE